MADAATAAAMMMAGRAAVNLKQRKTIAIGAGIVLAASFVGMVTSAYTADHVKRSSCESTDANLQKAYKWSWVSATVAAGSAVAAGAVLAAVMLKK